MNKLFFLLIFTTLFSCASKNAEKTLKKIPLTRNISVSANGFKSIFPKNALIKQTIHYIRKSKSERAQVIIKNATVLSVTVLSPFGIELMSLKFEDGRIEKISGIPGVKIDFFERAIADMLMIYGKKDFAESLLENQASLVDRPRKRFVKLNDLNLIEISYSDDDSWKSDVSYKHLELDYELKIKTVSIDYETIYK